MRKNQYEEALFRAEDDRYELDMCIEPGCGAIRAIAAAGRGDRGAGDGARPAAAAAAAKAEALLRPPPAAAAN